jgi:hypothetical protein
MEFFLDDPPKAFFFIFTMVERLIWLSIAAMWYGLSQLLPYLLEEHLQLSISLNTLRSILIILQKLEKNNLSFFASISSAKP